MTAWHKKYKALFAGMSDEELFANAREYNGYATGGHNELDLILNELEVRLKQKESKHETFDRGSRNTGDPTAILGGGS